MAGAAQRPGELISGVNVTPLVDVVLVLLIVLMVAASVSVSQAVPLELPQASTGETHKKVPLAISLEASGNLFLDGEKISEQKLRELLKLRRLQGGASALIAADGSAEHRVVIRVIDMLREEGVTKFAMNVAPVEKAAQAESTRP